MRERTGHHSSSTFLCWWPGYPCGWPTFPPFQINQDERIGPLSPYNSEILMIDGNTGTQLDVPPHSVTPPDSGLPNAGPFGRAYTDVVPAWQFGGEACVDRLPGSARQRARPERPDQEGTGHGLGERSTGRSGPATWCCSTAATATSTTSRCRRAAVSRPTRSRARRPAWPDPDPDCMEYLAGRKVMTLGTDSTSMGPLPDLAEPTHYAGLKHGMIWTESATGLGALPPTGAFYCMIGPKHAGGAYGEGRAFAVVGDPLARRLIESARKKNVVDLSVVLSDDLPVSGPGEAWATTGSRT